MLNADRQEAGARIAAASTAVDVVAVEQDVIDKIEKLLKVAAKAGTEEEASAFMAKAQSLMDQHNLSMAAIEQGSSGAKAAKRTDEKLRGGLYQFQRDLWKAVANLNFCVYFHLYERDREKVSKYWIKRYGGKANVPDWRKGGFVFRHRLVGRAVNVSATIAMLSYLENAIERIVRERIAERVDYKAREIEERKARRGYDDGQQAVADPLWGEWAVKYREGIADTVVEKVWERRREKIAEQKGQQFKAPTEGREGAQTGTGLSLMDVEEQETAANYDFMHGDGAYAKVLERRARWAAQHAEEEARRAQWAKDNPEEAKAEEEARRKSARRTPWNYGVSSKGDKTDHGAYWDGRDAGKNVSIDQQMGSGVRGLLK